MSCVCCRDERQLLSNRMATDTRTTRPSAHCATHNCCVVTTLQFSNNCRQKGVALFGARWDNSGGLDQLDNLAKIDFLGVSQKFILQGVHFVADGVL